MNYTDAHQHFWQYDPEKHAWINEEMDVLKKDFLPEDLEKVYAQNGINACISVQAEQSEAETEFLLALAKEHDFIKGVVGWVDLRADNLEERLAYFAKFPKLCGFRHIVQGEPAVDFILQKSFQKGIAALGQYGFTYDILIFPTQMAAALQTVKNFPNQKFVIDHLAKPYIKKGVVDGWSKYIQEMAACENVYCKISGMVTEADWKNWQYTDFVPYLDIVFEAFGPDRVLFGSDWPVCLLAGSYSNVKGILEHYIRAFSEEDKAKFWGENALKFYGETRG